ncbi:PssD/Cps14F family polysaccharide biosynthesis glycosyltransferase [Lactiplantibacillus plantarum]|uniref:PssD/Cps14F family polysaccharide biosynthesis glycosyltransferase n=1 Tax=Lactiplantibacillus plantarum TaxID=1590 RepID=UPI0023E04A27|nr:PssD/Cps14F family polysaccharide biosynthesis glycosyltransferase [Lactiplantibacillus plantarum]MDF3265841.1 PssD/Cps14F family polysaccharide biosynthesis glycosyltransferase [Lactiplantibacillus plantarum]
MKEDTLCFVASSGGHLQEILCLQELMLSKPSFLITEYDGIKNRNIKVPTYYVKQINRKEKLFFLHFIKLFFLFTKLMKKNKPKYIITTGALIAFPACIVGKIMGKRIIYIESFARVTHPSLTGKLIYCFADLFIIQWKPLLKYYPNAIYTGGIF